ncbi:DUF423 domain-containing protein [Candidatus Marinimicrobia bacterium]|nr:DUF423 domain-containing protein [Candidatus Neomarinimicrobiota bacterium]
MKAWLIVGASLAGISVLLGAFGAHGLKSKVSPEDLLIFETGVRYHMAHALGLILISLIGFQFSQDIIQLPAYLFSTGILIFSGSLYLLVLTNTRWLGAITPIGGLCFIAGWFILVYNLYKS